MVRVDRYILRLISEEERAKAYRLRPLYCPYSWRSSRPMALAPLTPMALAPLTTPPLLGLCPQRQRCSAASNLPSQRGTRLLDVQRTCLAHASVMPRSGPAAFSGLSRWSEAAAKGCLSRRHTGCSVECTSSGPSPGSSQHPRHLH